MKNSRDLLIKTISIASIIMIIFCSGLVVSILKKDNKMQQETESSSVTNSATVSNEQNIESRDNIVAKSEPYPFIIDDKAMQNKMKNDGKSNLIDNFVYLNREELPLTYKKLLVNHSDARTYIISALTEKKISFEEGQTIDLKRKYPYYIQWDRRWGANPLGVSDIAIGGCGPTVIAMALGGLLNDNNITPDKIADIENKAGYFSASGTSWGFFSYIANKYGVKSNNIGVNKNNLDKSLEKNNPVVASVIPGKFTTVGHIILIVGKDSEGKYIINDPNSYVRTLKSWSYDELKTEIRNMWEFSK